ncbi:MaoC family dehydratase [Neptunomonas japonica]|uniref:Acyl dehydratase n=1 Tax=Neptunomonas japonica JAMM 1380 TaxID=1441457 RepID=A0A7R6PFN6_9GAMM|nr:MaoC family dehydratase [Neptunomonas japonica]BBB28718.1 acyl dehydratase [Neptunomonas japonica JAMM 1380]
MTELILGNIPIEDICEGMKASYSQTITDADVKAYAGLSGDHNPVHVSDHYAESSHFGKRIAHGLMSAGFFSALFGMRLPGPGCVYVSQNLKFLRPVYIGDTVIASIEVKSVDALRRRVQFKTVCTVSDKVVINGQAEIYIPA